MDDEPTAGSSDNRQQAALDAMREILTPLVEEAGKRRRGRPRKDAGASAATPDSAVPAHLSSKGRGRATNRASSAMGASAGALTPDAITARSVPPNALTHGLTSNAVVIPGVESEEEWQAFRAGIIDDLEPDGATQQAVAERIATLFWRLHRVARFESQSIAASIDAVEVDYRRTWGYGRGSLKQAEAYRDTAERRLALLRQLPSMPLGTYIDGEDADEILDLLGADDVELPEELVAYVEGETDANGTLLMIAAKAIAEKRNRSLEDIFAQAINGAEAAVAEAAENVDYAVTTQDRMRRERQSPPESYIRTAGRYEAQLDRALHRAMTLYETLKAAKEGRPIPLNRIQLQA